MSPTREPKPVKAPSARPYRKPEPAVKQKRVIHTVSERDGMNLLRKIQANGGRDLIVTIQSSEQTPKEIAESLVSDNEIVKQCLDSYGGGKDRFTRLRVAIEQAPLYQLDIERPVIVGAKKQQRQEEAEAKRREIASRKRNPKTREPVIPTVEEILPKRGDQDVVREELKQYFADNANLGTQVLNASTDDKAASVLLHNVGRQFDGRIKKLLAAPANYRIYLAEAVATLRSDMRKHDAAIEGSTLATKESPEIPASLSVGEKALARYDEVMGAKGRTVSDTTNDPEAQEREERYAAQNAALSRFMATHPELT